MGLDSQGLVWGPGSGISDAVSAVLYEPSHRPLLPHSTTPALLCSRLKPWTHSGPAPLLSVGGLPFRAAGPPLGPGTPTAPSPGQQLQSYFASSHLALLEPSPALACRSCPSWHCYWGPRYPHLPSHLDMSLRPVSLQQCGLGKSLNVRASVSIVT